MNNLIKRGKAYTRAQERFDRLDDFANKEGLTGLSNKEVNDYALNQYRNAYSNEIKNYGRLVGASMLGRMGLNGTHALVGSGLKALGLKDWGNYIGETNSRRRNWLQWAVQTGIGALPAWYLGKYGYKLGGDIADSYVKGNFGNFEDDVKNGFNNAFSPLDKDKKYTALERALRANYLNDHVNNKYNNAYLPVHALSALAAGGISDRMADYMGLGPQPDDNIFAGKGVGRWIGKGLMSSAATMIGASAGPYFLNKLRSTSIDPLPAKLSVNKKGRVIPAWDKFYNNWLHAALPGGYMTSPYYADPLVEGNQTDFNSRNRDAFFNKMVRSHDRAMDRAKNISNVVDATSDILWTQGKRLYNAGSRALGRYNRANRNIDNVVPPDVRYRP